MYKAVIVIEKFEKETKYKATAMSSRINRIRMFSELLNNNDVKYKMIPLDYDNDIYLFNFITEETSSINSNYQIYLKKKQISLPIKNDDIFIIGKINFITKKMDDLNDPEISKIIKDDIEIIDNGKKQPIEIYYAHELDKDGKIKFEN